MRIIKGVSAFIVGMAYGLVIGVMCMIAAPLTLSQRCFRESRWPPGPDEWFEKYTKFTYF